VLKLPKDLVGHPRHDDVARLLTTNASPLWAGGRQAVPTVAMTAAAAAALRGALAAEVAYQGLEAIAEKLAAEQKGLDALARKLSSPQNARLSRILFLASDGSPRFLRDCDALLVRYPERLIACRLDVAGEALGEAIFGRPKIVRGVLVADRKACADALLTLLPEA
jgi:hypothetical protein